MPSKIENKVSQSDSYENQESEFPTVSREEKYEQLLSIFLEAEKNWKGGR
mgnify:CR=1 FL=1|tara:strand:- start:180 stop:329 length:150 start_codon:yes stop_codon:yes gene_type:complete